MYRSNKNEISRQVKPTLRRYIPVVALALAIVAITPVNTQITTIHMFTMNLLLLLAVLAPYVISKYIYKDGVIIFPFFHDKRWWHSKFLLFLLFVCVLSYIVWPIYLTNTGAYHDWVIGSDFNSLARLFYGINILGAWDEFFFVAVMLAILSRFMNFWIANAVVASLWVYFLYEFAFRSWGLAMIFVFALIQGYIFKRTKSLDYILTTHLNVDFFLFLALIHAAHPHLVRIFIWN